jgi:taurine dioxygenase
VRISTGLPGEAILLGDNIGLAIAGVDAKMMQLPEVRPILEKLVAQYHVLKFPNQKIDEDEQIAISQSFGGDHRDVLRAGYPWIPPVDTPKRGGWLYHSKRALYVMYGPDLFEPGEPVSQIWHVDSSWLKMPPCYTFTYGVEIPPNAPGGTQFASQTAAYDLLSDAMRERIENLHAAHESVPRSAKGGVSVHRVVRTHPLTGRKYLYVNRLFTTRITELDESESARLLEELFAATEQEQLLWLHRWRQGDLLMFDHRGLIHRGYNVEPHVRRVLRQVTAKEDLEASDP